MLAGGKGIDAHRWFITLLKGKRAKELQGVMQPKGR